MEELEKFKREATSILESAKFPVDKWQFDVEYLESEDSTNPSKILGTVWEKRDDMLETQVPEPPDNQPLTKREILSHFAREDITWQFNLSRSSWWGGMYERLIKDVKKTPYKTLGRTTPSFEQLEMVIIDKEKHLNNHPLTYLESDGGEEQVLTPNVLMWGPNAHQVEETEEDGDEVSKLHKRLRETKQHAWRMWKHKYIHSLLESH